MVFERGVGQGHNARRDHWATKLSNLGNKMLHFLDFVQNSP